MERVRLGRTGLMVSRTAFGALPLQRVDREEAARLLRRAFEAGINFFDTARGYTDSEEKIGYALAGVRAHVVIATKSGATSRDGVLAHLETSLRHLRTDYVDLLQLHNPGTPPDPTDPASSYAGLLEARRRGMARHIGITNHRADVALAAVESGLYDTLQFPLCAISSARDVELVERCRQRDVGFIAMKPLSGGLLTNARAAFAFLYQYPNVVPIWGIQRMGELEELLALAKEPPALDAEVAAAIEKDRCELAGDFCRACGYCLPCPADIPIPMAARMGLVLRRMPYQQFLSPQWQEQMHRVEACKECGECRERCPYGLDVPALLRRNLADYEAFLRASGA
ncbi:MAG: aldo/keto reductase [Armatimonadota bacterium]|nr:aldo/keto reductase [Armatimonadota bacterium]